MATDILMPALSPTMTEGKLARWLKAEGDTVAAGDVIAEIETDKATMEVEAVDEGILGRILIQEGAEGIPVNTPIAILVEDGESVPDTSSTQMAVSPKAETASAETMPAAPVSKAPAEDKGERIFVSPLAKRMARERGIALDALTGSGPNGRILKRDVEKGPSAPKMAPKAAATPLITASEETVRRVPNSTMRKVIARRLTESKTQVPHFYVSVDIELDALLALRSKLNATAQENSFKISVNDMMIKAVALALKKVPGVNVQFTEAETLHFENVDISMAVSIPDGLITPIIRDADRKSLRDISVEAKDLAKRARAGKLKPEEFQGGTFSISNMGMFGVREFAAIINPPQAGILAIASGEKRAVVRGSDIAIATVMTATLSVDHRAVDGALGAEWLNALRDIVQNPYFLVV
ncbi:pyruvate dehydrogenase complex dihydrolipoamide acetyltransferase [Gluconobacter albidus]|uniref:Acetyltransferase component of pyruvate dehydrogenase complex n=1 Tax=Gluconobacter albidus TaxID=318683 RepID=A0AAW3QTV0_9PROT|nr:pyruvate dehydrogenase complex dihydrolipoamide acetyltransferase [Gluconobacter albidus]KXV37085.1 branched-chain alpha-keto acid dehydrogenase subunit E2 [Gluconobacter albidus]MBS1028835.1 pyruvate dehydrogenase complex dihydrolipoamide acetyltransferase [Gluconobacter albidus]GBQ86933.1 dihydrolipoamide acetyltransferase component [Gluconobacter albidus NBRC 3250]GLQ69251.1 acetyltransferase component of pyruvate dehydrogenase complex [Gluconobacter albidus]